MFAEVDAVVADIAEGKFVIVLDDEDRENEGDLIVSAATITTEQMAWFIKHTRYVCAASLTQRLYLHLAHARAAY